MILLPDQPPYKSPINTWYTDALFFERQYTRSSETRCSNPKFTLKGNVDGLIDCRSTFVNLGDLTGYSWAMLYLNSWEHMERLMNTRWFMNEMELWQRELVVKMRMEALQKLKEIADGTSNSAAAASRFIVEEGWNKTTGRGRPSQADKDKALSDAVKGSNIEQDDMARIGLRVINGDKN